ncbi:hypothetical protein FQZ97_871410 [compost metagenome]
MRRVPRLVGRRAARARQPDAAGPHLHTQGHGRTQPERAEEPKGHCLRAGQPAAGIASEPQCTGRLDGDDRTPERSRRPKGLRAVAGAFARGLHRAWHCADLRRGLRRVSAGARRSPGTLWRAGRSGHLRQDARWRSAGGRGLWQGRLDAAVSPRTPGRHLLCPRHLQCTPLRHGSDERVSAAVGDT